ncbi:UNVERIFIED_CONTAM: tRNA pseudouridine synthase A [Sesamum calycinum]|uniref:tRNA pseudouridine synthase n=1 Tax=Sesamum calycinum TaxID=2727403 RepID=A0AAW2PPZ5_9LAMI
MNQRNGGEREVTSHTEAMKRLVRERGKAEEVKGQGEIKSASRSDAGVHALSNVCHVDVERISKRKPGEVKNEGDIMVIDVRCVPSDFHSRYKAQERTYFYRLLSGKEPLSTFEKDRAWHVPEDLDLLAMQAKSPIRTLEELTVTEVASSPYFPSILEREQRHYAKSGTDSPCIPGAHGFGVRQRHHCFVVTARARSFLYHQVRLLVGVLKSMGTGDLTVDDVERILKAKTISAASPMAPACGLYLGHVKYDLHSDV